MLALSRKADYAIIAVAGLAAAGEAGASSRELSERFSLPLPLLRNLLKRLAQVGLVTSTRGSDGGYQIALPLERISVADLVQAIEGPWRLAACCGECEDAAESQQSSKTAKQQMGTGLCEIEGTCPVKRPVRRLHACLSTVLEQISLAEVVEDRMPTRIVLERRTAAPQRQSGEATNGAQGSSETVALELMKS